MAPLLCSGVWQFNIKVFSRAREREREGEREGGREGGRGREFLVIKLYQHTLSFRPKKILHAPLPPARETRAATSLPTSGESHALTFHWRLFCHVGLLAGQPHSRPEDGPPGRSGSQPREGNLSYSSRHCRGATRMLREGVCASRGGKT